METLFPSLAFAIVGLAAMYVLNSHLSQREKFVQALADVQEMQNVLQTYLSTCQETMQQIQSGQEEMKRDVTALKVKAHIRN